MRATSEWKDGMCSVTDNHRGHTVTVDLPPAKGGFDHGPTALELAVMALAGCVTTIFAVHAAKRDLTFESLRVDVTARQSAEASTVDEIHGRVVVGTAEPEARVEEVHRLTLDRCPVGVLYRRGGVKETWELSVER